MTPGFANSVFHVATGDGHNVILLRDEPYTDLNGDEYLLPAGGASDGGSEPPMLWGPPFNLPPFGPEWQEYFLHDAAYRNYLLKKVNGEWAKANLSFVQCNDLLWNAMVIKGISFIRRTSILNGLKACGMKSYAEDRK